MNRYVTAAMAAWVAGGLGVAACTANPAGSGPAGNSMPVASLRGSDAATADAAPEGRAQLGKKPGSQAKIARTFEGQPPLIPHATENFDEVTLDANQCLECHGAEYHVAKNAPKISDTHFIDAQGKQLADTDHRRHACQLCHVPQFDAPPLVDNGFVGAPARPVR